MQRDLEQEIYGVIPARLGGQRFPRKILAPILGKSLIQHTFENAKRFTRLKKLVVATDTEEIAGHVRSFGGEVILTSSECRNGTERMQEVMEKMGEVSQNAIFINIQGDEPLVSPHTLTAITDLLMHDKSASMATAASLIEKEEDATSPSVVKCVFTQNGNALYFSRSLIPGSKQGVWCEKTPYYRHIGIYAYRKDLLANYTLLSETPLQKTEDLEQLKILEHGYIIKIAVVQERSLGIDTPDDISKIEKILCKQNTSLSRAVCAPL